MSRSGRVLPALILFGVLVGSATAADKVTPRATINTALIPRAELASMPVIERACDRATVAKMIDELREPASASSPSVEIRCSLTLPENMVITKRLIFKGDKSSGVTVQGEGTGAIVDGSKGTYNYNTQNAALMVQIISDACQLAANGEPRCSRPQNITIRNLKIKGSVGISGDPGVPSTDARFVRLARTNAPANIVFDRVTITGLGLPCGEKSANCTLLYLFSGVSNFRMLNSEINGLTSEKAVAIYLDDVSFRNTFRNNTISANTPTREVIAIDGSSENVFVNNRVKVGRNDGIRLYRNCGEEGSPRRGTPSNNTFINNIFVFDAITPEQQAIFLASRNGRGTKTYTCPPNFFDLAKFNVVMQNQFVPDQPHSRDSESLGYMVLVDRPDVNTPNFIKENEIVDRRLSRGAGCFISNGYPDFIQDGQFVNVFQNANGYPMCSGYRLTCRDGELARSSDATCDVNRITSRVFWCAAGGNNGGCNKTFSGPPGKKIIGFKAACDLETGSVPTYALDKVPANAVKVMRASDHASEGRCTIGSASIQSGESAVGGIIGQTSVTMGCREKDSNGGDCQIKARVFFQ